MAKLNFDFLFQYLQTATPAGFELEGQKTFLNYLRPYLRPTDSWDVDNFQNLIIKIASKKERTFDVVLEAHVDEISWVVSYIDGDGYIWVQENGGVHPVTAVTKRCHIYTRKGEVVEGVFGFLAPHLKSAEEKKSAPTVGSLFIDVGATKRKDVLEMGIKIGDPVIYRDGSFILNKKFVVGRGLDNKIGGFCIAETARYFLQQNIDLPFNLYIVNATQEEVGKRGASVIAQRLKPAIAIVTDVGHDTTSPGAPYKSSGVVGCGSGPIVCSAPALHKIFAKYVRIRATKESVPYQLRAKGKDTGTDADVFAHFDSIVSLIQIPLRYMHTTIESVAISDIEATIKLFVATLENLDGLDKFSYKKFIDEAAEDEDVQPPKTEKHEPKIQDVLDNEETP